MSAESLTEIAQLAKDAGNGKLARATEAVLRARDGDFDKSIPSINAFQGVLQEFLQHDLMDGWIYVTGQDRHTYPELVTSIEYDNGTSRGRNDTPSLLIWTMAYGLANTGHNSRHLGSSRRAHRFAPQDVVRRRVADAFAAKGIYKESPELRAAYDQSIERHKRLTQNAFAKQFRFTGAAYAYETINYRREKEEFHERRVIHDLERSQYAASASHYESFLFDDHPTANGLGMVPDHPLVRVFDLSTHECLWVHGDSLTPYQYDQSLREKLVLPDSHRDLLDVLTSDIDDIIEGKSAGNVILCKGIPGVGKTLTAEVYAELTQRPLYAIHSGSLGTTADTIQANLKTIFQRAQRWGCVLLLDEADVFVVQRGNNIQQNTIVAEFLRTLEYFTGLMFMTTNRPDDIDEAIVSRCAAIIDYHPPTPQNAAAIWRVMATQYRADLDDELITKLVATFPKIAPRDIKMLLRLALRVSNASNEPLTLEAFRRCAMFRAIDMVSTPAA